MMTSIGCVPWPSIVLFCTLGTLLGLGLGEIKPCLKHGMQGWQMTPTRELLFNCLFDLHESAPADDWNKS